MGGGGDELCVQIINAARTFTAKGKNESDGPYLS